MFENISLSFQGIWSHKLRSFLTMLGIIIGIASIITIVSTIKGTNEQIKENLVGAGNNVVNVQLSQDGYPYEFGYESLPAGVQVVDDETLASLEKLEGVQSVATYHQRTYVEQVFYKNTPFNGSIYGVSRNYLKINSYSTIYGRGFSENDFDMFRKVAILDSKAAHSLLQGESPVGKTIEIKGEPFVIIGVVDKINVSGPAIQSYMDFEMYATDSTGVIFIPEASWPIVYQYDEPKNVAVRATTTDDMTTAGKNVADALNDALVSTKSIKYEANDLLEQAQSLQQIANATSSQLLWIAGISLLVGGIGVMNIMLVSVTERTREIGLKKALGAKRKRILMQFLTEAAVLTCFGGLLGVLCGIGLAKILAAVAGTPVAISVPACVIAVAFSVIIGVVFGMVPAMKASKLNPIEALRHE